MGKALGVRTLLHHHGAEFIDCFARAGRARRFWYRRVIMSADVNIVLGQLWGRHLVDCVGLPEHRVVVLYNAIPDRFDNACARTQAAKQQLADVRLVMLANLMPRKGVSELLRAIRDLKSDGIEVSADLVGGGDIGRYRKEAASLGIESECHFTGWISPHDSFERLCAADIFVLPSFNEGLPMAILEALCAGVPVIATPVGAIPEVLTSGTNCLLIPPGDPVALRNAINKLRLNPYLRSSISAAGRTLFAQSFAIRQYVQSLRSIYEQLLKTDRDLSLERAGPAEGRVEPGSA
ncbi:MAG TPA: glycosyltransferase family 4 protein [Rhizomicrobium sp.]|nr:glycosyltransferase family 4 protein [Rhizomicrobium sp.]